MTTTPGGDRGRVGTAEGAGGTSTVPTAPDLVLSRHARRLRWHHVLTRRRRWSKELDQIVGRWEQPLRRDPWQDEEFLAEHALVLDSLRPAVPTQRKKLGGLEPWE